MLRAWTKGVLPGCVVEREDPLRMDGARRSGLRIAVDLLLAGLGPASRSSLRSTIASQRNTPVATSSIRTRWVPGAATSTFSVRNNERPSREIASKPNRPVRVIVRNGAPAVRNPKRVVVLSSCRGRAALSGTLLDEHLHAPVGRRPITPSGPGGPELRLHPTGRKGRRRRDGRHGWCRRRRHRFRRRGAGHERPSDESTGQDQAQIELVRIPGNLSAPARKGHAAHADSFGRSVGCTYPPPIRAFSGKSSRTRTFSGC